MPKCGRSLLLLLLLSTATLALALASVVTRDVRTALANVDRPTIDWLDGCHRPLPYRELSTLANSRTGTAPSALTALLLAHVQLAPACMYSTCTTHAEYLFTCITSGQVPLIWTRQRVS